MVKADQMCTFLIIGTYNYTSFILLSFFIVNLYNYFPYITITYHNDHLFIKNIHTTKFLQYFFQRGSLVFHLPQVISMADMLIHPDIRKARHRIQIIIYIQD